MAAEIEIHLPKQKSVNLSKVIAAEHTFEHI